MSSVGTMRVSRWIVVCCLAAHAGAAGAAAPAHLYWTLSGDSRALECAPLETPTAATLVAPLAQPRDVAIDSLHRRVYWADPGAGRIQRADLDGANVEDVLTGLTNPRSIEVDPVAGKLYWTDVLDGTVSRADLDGSDPETLVSGLVLPFGLALDAAAGRLYWTDPGTGKIQTAGLDGNDPTDVISGLGGPRYLAFDETDGELFWTQMSPAVLMRANSDGTAATTIGTTLPFSGAVALDPEGDHVYWANGFETIWRARQDGSEPTPFLTNLDSPAGLALLPAIAAAPVPALGTPGTFIAGALLVAYAFALLAPKPGRRSPTAATATPSSPPGATQRRHLAPRHASG